MHRAMQVQSPCTKIPMDAAGGDARVLEVHGAQAHGRSGGCSVMLSVVRAVLAILWCLWGEGLREGGEIAMPAQILHVTNQGQSVRQRVKEGMKGRPVGLPDNPPPPVSVWG